MRAQDHSPSSRHGVTMLHHQLDGAHQRYIHSSLTGNDDADNFVQFGYAAASPESLLFAQARP